MFIYILCFLQNLSMMEECCAGFEYIQLDGPYCELIFER